MKQRKDLEKLENIIGKVKNPPEGQGGTPEIDKYMKEHPYGKVDKKLHPIQKANMVILKGLDLITGGYTTRKQKEIWSEKQDEKERAEARKS